MEGWNHGNEWKRDTQPLQAHTFVRIGGICAGACTRERVAKPKQKISLRFKYIEKWKPLGYPSLLLSFHSTERLKA